MKGIPYSPYILREETADKVFLFNSKNNHTISVTKLFMERASQDKALFDEYSNYLADHGYLAENGELDQALKDFKQRDSQLLRLIILPHGDCNLRCKYCYEIFEKQLMTQAVADHILAFTEDKMKQGAFKTLQVSWFGGEPILGLPIIEKLSDALISLAKSYQLDYQSDMTTNGYLLNARTFSKLVNQWRVTSFQVTLDGTARGHDKQRVMQNGSGSYQRIYDNLKNFQENDLKAQVLLRFNVSKDNYEDVRNFLKTDGLIFKNDPRFGLIYRNVGDWGQGERACGYEVGRFETDKGYELSQEAIASGYCVVDPHFILSNYYSCYAQKPNTYLFDVRGNIKLCTVKLYDSKNQFGNVIEGKLNEDKRQAWLNDLALPKECQNCSYALLCKSGACPKQLIYHEKTQAMICARNQKLFKQNFCLLIQQNLVDGEIS